MQNSLIQSDILQICWITPIIVPEVMGFIILNGTKLEKGDIKIEDLFFSIRYLFSIHGRKELFPQAITSRCVRIQPSQNHHCQWTCEEGKQGGNDEYYVFTLDGLTFMWLIFLISMYIYGCGLDY